MVQSLQRLCARANGPRPVPRIHPEVMILGLLQLSCHNIWGPCLGEIHHGHVWHSRVFGATCDSSTNSPVSASKVRCSMNFARSRLAESTEEGFTASASFSFSFLSFFSSEEVFGDFTCSS